MKKCIVERASAFHLGFKLSNPYLWDYDDTLPKSWFFFPFQAKLSTISLLSVYLLILACSVILFPMSMETYHFSVLPLSWKIQTKIHIDFRNQEDICHLLPSFGFGAAEGDALHVFCLPIRREIIGESVERNEVIISHENLHLSRYLCPYCVWIKERPWCGTNLVRRRKYDFVIWDAHLKKTKNA